MPTRHPAPLPRLWLMTDERQGDGLWDALMRLPRGSGVVFRHYASPPDERRALLRRVHRIARRRRLVLVAGGTPSGVRIDGVHGRGRSRGGFRTAPVHRLREMVAAERNGAALLFVSPVYSTRSHPGARMLGRVRFGMLARRARVPVIALGGMTARRWRSLQALGAYGWAAIDALTVRT